MVTRTCFALLLAGWALTAIGCGGSGNGSALPLPMTPPPATLAIVSAYAAPGPAPSALVIYSGQFLAPFTDEQVVKVTISPAPLLQPQISWSASNANVVVAPADPHYSGVAPTAPPGASYVAEKKFGLTSVAAIVGAPFNVTISIPVYAYGSLSFGCDFRGYPGYAFSTANTATIVNAPTGSDLYETSSPESNAGGVFSPCTNSAFTTPAGSGMVTHFPFGATLIAGNLSTFPLITATQWRNAGSDSTQVNGSGILLFKTSSGAVVKFLGTIGSSLTIGPFEVTDATGNFPY